MSFLYFKENQLSIILENSKQFCNLQHLSNRLNPWTSYRLLFETFVFLVSQQFRSSCSQGHTVDMLCMIEKLFLRLDPFWWSDWVKLLSFSKETGKDGQHVSLATKWNVMYIGEAGNDEITITLLCILYISLI